MIPIQTHYNDEWLEKDGRTVIDVDPHDNIISITQYTKCGDELIDKIIHLKPGEAIELAKRLQLAYEVTTGDRSSA